MGISCAGQRINVVPDPTEQQTVLSLITRQVMGDGPYFWVAPDGHDADPGPRREHELRRLPAPARASSPATASCPVSSAFAGSGWRSPPESLPSRGLATLLLVVFQASGHGAHPALHAGRLRRVHPFADRDGASAGGGGVGPGWRLGLLINGLGAATTGVIALIVASTKFLSGAWLVIVMAPILIAPHARHPGALPRRSARRWQLDHIPEGTRGRHGADRDRADRAPRPPGPPGDRLRQLHLGHPTAVHVTNDPATAAAAARALAELGRGRPSWSWSSRRTAPSSARCSPTWTPSKQDPSPTDPRGPHRVRAASLVGESAAQPDRLRLKLRLFARRNTIVADVPYHLPSRRRS